MRATIVLLPGDGIGPEVLAEGVGVLAEVGVRFGHDFVFSKQLVGGAAIDEAGEPLPPATVAACRAADAVFLGAIGGPKWDSPGRAVRPEQGLLALRRELGLFANLRPTRPYPELADASPLRPERTAGVDLLVVRELTGGLYFGQPRSRETAGGVTRAVDTLEYTDVEIRRVVRVAFQLAARRRGLVTSIDKANVLESSRLWREIANEVGAEHPGVRLEHQLVDSAALRLLTSAQAFDVLVTENMFGDILTDEAGALVGSLGMMPSASLGEGTRGLYEPIHGSAPDLAGRGVANPIGAILSAGMLLRHSLGLLREADAVEAAVASAIADGVRTADIGRAGAVSTEQMGAEVRRRLGRPAL
jgi:3-isopropylmalate dehydrogenase